MAQVITELRFLTLILILILILISEQKSEKCLHLERRLAYVS